jgi:hypothetical protein
LCRLVCPILINLEPDSTTDSLLLDDRRSNIDALSPSINGLGIFLDGEAKNDPPLAKLADNGEAVGTSSVGGAPVMFKNASACHSYHTWRWFVKRQMETWSSELLGRYNGS